MNSETRRLICDKIMDYAKGTVQSYGGNTADGVFALGYCHFSLHAAMCAAETPPVPLEEAIVHITRLVAGHYPDVYRRVKEAMESL